jgi:hypothetical protein
MEVSDQAASMDFEAYVHQKHHRQEVLRQTGASLCEHPTRWGQGGEDGKMGVESGKTSRSPSSIMSSPL